MRKTRGETGNGVRRFGADTGAMCRGMRMMMRFQDARTGRCRHG
jgi:hypothetical protein